MLISRKRTGHHEFEVLYGKENETEESERRWKNCKKNPGHVKFISPQDFKDNYLPSFLTGKNYEEFCSIIDCTVRLRVSWTSRARLNGEKFSGCRGTHRLRLGTGCMYTHGDRVSSLDNEPCPCNECEGKVIRKHWKFSVHTAHHVVYNTEEAKQTKVDLFYDDESCQQDGRMKTVGSEGVKDTTR
ncbi:hypothetical protein ElyMa_004075600 [Elysia marginata]|uniref:C2H2-type domain-containing protein n=1 Tax=Elysia marginata TaxID=1093978 RepID=A0AAV4GAH1_9GAST|nr:hypothetical protein ElyMa_004075600 [Elysia marginata]